MPPTRKPFVAPRLVEVASLASLTQGNQHIITDCGLNCAGDL